MPGPGPVSDSFDPEFGTAANADDVCAAIRNLRDHIASGLGDLRGIVEVVQEPQRTGPYMVFHFSERERRIIRFALNRALESL